MDGNTFFKLTLKNKCKYYKNLKTENTFTCKIQHSLCLDSMHPPKKELLITLIGSMPQQKFLQDTLLVITFEALLCTQGPADNMCLRHDPCRNPLQIRTWGISGSSSFTEPHIRELESPWLWLRVGCCLEIFFSRLILREVKHKHVMVEEVVFYTSKSHRTSADFNVYSQSKRL